VARSAVHALPDISNRGVPETFPFGL